VPECDLPSRAPLGSLQRYPRLLSWIYGEGKREGREIEWKGGDGEEEREKRLNAVLKIPLKCHGMLANRNSEKQKKLRSLVPLRFVEIIRTALEPTILLHFGLFQTSASCQRS